MGMEGVEDVVVVGAGICGLATAVALKRYGIEAVVLERAEGLRATGAALTLGSNAWLALDALGVSHKLNPLYSPITKYVITNVSTGAVQHVPLPRTEGGLGGPKTMHRKAILEALAEDIEGSSIAILQMENGTIIKTKVLIGCDGVHSQVARWLGLGEPVNSGRFGLRGLSVFPKGHGFDHQVTRFVQGGFDGGFVPITDTDLYLFLATGNSAAPGDLDITAKTPPELIQRYVIEHY